MDQLEKPPRAYQPTINLKIKSQKNLLSIIILKQEKNLWIFDISLMSVHLTLSKNGGES